MEGREGREHGALARLGGGVEGGCEEPVACPTDPHCREHFPFLLARYKVSLTRHKTTTYQ